jgi:elongation factor Ts
MAGIPMELIKKLREMSGAGMMDCKSALEEADSDLEKAFTILREKGMAKASKRAGRATGQGVVEAYLHRTGEDFPPQVGVLVEVNCETDFVAKGDDFRKLAKELALQVAGFGARWVSREDVPDEVLVEERNVYQAKAEQDGKPPQVIPRIVDGQVEQFLKENCLLEQGYFREPKHTVQEIIAEHISKLQENITIRRFARFNVREA